VPVPRGICRMRNADLQLSLSLSLSHLSMVVSLLDWFSPLVFFFFIIDLFLFLFFHVMALDFFCSASYVPRISPFFCHPLHFLLFLRIFYR
jgi:hypothetical protein